MSVGWKCNICGTVYEKKPQDGYCKIHELELLVPLEVPEPAPVTDLVLFHQEIPKEETDPTLVQGLGVLVCDVSGSMDEVVFPKERKDLTRLQLVVGAAQSALLNMLDLSDKDRAYVAIIAFGKGAQIIRDRQKRPFIRSVRSIINEFG